MWTSHSSANKACFLSPDGVRTKSENLGSGSVCRSPKGRGRLFPVSKTPTRHASMLSSKMNACRHKGRRARPVCVGMCVKSMMWRGPSQSKNKADARAGGAGGGRRRRRRRTYHGSLAAIPTEELKIDNEPNRSPYYRPRSRNGSSTSMYVFSVESSAAAMMGVLR